MINLKKFISLLLISGVLFTNSLALAIEEKEAKTNLASEVNVNFIAQTKLENEIFEQIKFIYGEENAQEIFNEVIKLAQNAKKTRSKSLKALDSSRANDWYKDEIIYMFYVDQFGVKDPNSANTFKDTQEMFNYLKDLGVTTLYMLPFAESPMGDSGFDVKNPRNIRSDLGGMPEFIDFINKAKKEGFKIKADLVLNHFSDKHEWFTSLENGDLSKLDYFISTDTAPDWEKYTDKKLGTVVKYYEDDGSISNRRLIFPESSENHWRELTINNKKYYIYHTFYPFQLDINWQNPNVLYYSLQTISHWCNLGIDIFRLDAVPYYSKDKGTNAENQPKTHAILKLISSYIQLTSPASVIQVEACQPPKDLLEYFGKERTVETTVEDTALKLKRTDEAQIAYNFPYMPALWASMISKNKDYFLDAYKLTPSIPSTASWGTFLRVHDELTLEMVTPEIRHLIYNDLAPKGAAFRKGFGVSGRLANFLDKNPDRIELAFSLLLSMPGIPIIYYGDEIGAANNFEYAKEKEVKRKFFSKTKLLNAFDSRDIHRGNIAQKLFYGSQKDYYVFNSKIYKKVKNLINLRKSLPVMSRGEFIPLKTASKANFSYIRKDKDKEILVINNLSNEKLTAEITLPINIILKNNGHIKSLKNLVNGDNIKVDISLKNKTMHLRVAPYGIVWIDLPIDKKVEKKGENNNAGSVEKI